MKKRIARGKIIACIDIGSSKLMCIIASIDGENIRILGYAHKESRGISYGAISDMRLAQKSITNTVSEAEKMAGINIERLVVSISGNQIKSNRISEGVKISSSMVKNSDISNLASKVRSTFRRKNQEMIHLIPTQYNIDDSSPVQNPRYMSGDKLFAKFHSVSTSKTTILNIENCLKRCQISVNNYVAEPYASAIACLSENEMNLGTLLIDFGGDVTSMALMLENKLVYAGGVAIGGNHITKDIATIIKTDLYKAEKIKNLNANLLLTSLEQDELIDLGTSKDNFEVRLTKSELCEIISCRIEEILESIKTALEKAGVPEFLINNIVITGGVSSIVGIDKITEQVFEKTVRINSQLNIKNIPEELDSPKYSCSLGMLIFSKNLLSREKIKGGFEVKGSWFRNFINKIVSA